MSALPPLENIFDEDDEEEAVLVSHHIHQTCSETRTMEEE